jgi:hypothetical protein
LSNCYWYFINVSRAYAESLKHPEKVQVETHTINPSNATTGVRPALFILGIGQFTVRVYLLGFVPYGIGLYLPLATARNLQGSGTAAAAAITAAIVAANPKLAPFSPVIAAALVNILNTVPNFVVNVCGAAGGGFTMNFVAAIPVPYCGAIPA